MIGEIVEAVEIVKSVEPESSKEKREVGMAEKGGIKHRRTLPKGRRTERSELVEMCELNWFGGGILLSGVFFDLTQFNFHGLLFSQKKEDHPHHQDQNHYKSEYKDVSEEVSHS